MADSDEAIRLDPKFAAAFNARGNLYRATGDLQRAMADYDEAIRLDGKTPIEFVNRGTAHQEQGDLKRAITDYGEAVRLKPTDVYPALWLYLARARSGDPAASAELESNAKQFKASEWPYPLVEFYLGRSSLEATLAAPTKSDDRCAAQFYIGEWQLLQADRSAAITSLNAAIDICPKTFVEYRAAQAELKRLGQ
jgi:lipoprotein NlpI